jgi:hypothetical protein
MRHPEIHGPLGISYTAPWTMDTKLRAFLQRVMVTAWCQWKHLDSLFEKTPIITPEKQTAQPGDAFEYTAFKPGFEIVKC